MKMISNMKTKEKIILFISIFFLVTIMGIGISFAYYTAVVLNGESKSSIISQSGNLEITYVDGEKQILGVSVFPGWHDSKTFTVKNTGDNATTYSIKVTNITNTFTIANSISLSLESSDGGKNMGKRTLPRNEATIVKYVSIDAGDTHTYTVTTYYNNLDIDQSADKGKRFSYTIEVGASVGTNDTLIAQIDTNSSTAKVFNGPITKEQVESITFKDTNKVPSNAVASWDVSKAQNGSIMAYTLNEDSDDLYELYIGQEGGVTLGQDASYMFGYYSSLSSMDLTYLDTSNVTNMYGMFYNSSATTLDLSSFDTSNVTNMYGMFNGSKATSLDLSSFDTSKVTNMSFMFYKSAATEIKRLNNFNTSKVTDMSGMFGYSKLTTLDLSSFDTSNVKNMFYMFFYSVATKIKGLNNFNTSKVTNMFGMFFGTKATSLDLSSFDTSNVTNMKQMFYMSVATEIKGLNDFNTSEVTNMGGMFGYSKLTCLDLSSFDTSKVTNMYQMFYNSAATEIKGLNNFNTSKVTDMSYMFGHIKLTTLDLSSFDTSNVTNMSGMFDNSAATEIKGLNNFSTNKVTNMSFMFRISKLTTLDLSGFDTSNVTNMSRMFSNSKSTNIVLSSWDTSKVTDMSFMFYSLSTTNVTGLDKLNTSSVTNMSYMFYEYPGEFIELLSFNTSKVTDMSYMFGRSKLDYIDLSSFDTTNVTNMTNMFQQVSLITGYARTSADAAKFNDRTVTGTATTNLFTVKN